METETKKIKITYDLSLAGQRALLLAGGDGKEKQSGFVDATPALIAIANVDSEGALSLYLDYTPNGNRMYFDAPLADVAAEALKVAAEKTAEKAKQAVYDELEERRKKDIYQSDVREVEAAIELGKVDFRDGGVVVGSGRRYHFHNFPVTLGPRLQAAYEADQAAEHEREEAREKAKAEHEARMEVERQAKAAERDAWIAAHGSERLKKGIAAGLIGKMAGVYRSERILVDLGKDWKSWDAMEENDDSDRLNPSEAELDALLELRKRFPDESLEAQLQSVRFNAGYEEGSTDWRPALMTRLPWDREKWAVKYL